MSGKAPPRRIRFEDVDFRPRGEGGDVAMLSMLTGDAQGTELGTGFGRLNGARLEWTVAYGEVLLVLEGALRVTVPGRVFDLGPMDTVWLPAGTELVYEADEALVFFAPGMRVTEAERRMVARRHQRLFDARFPMLRGVEIAHTWSGFVALTRNSAPGFGRLRGGVHAACFQNAIGITKGTIGGLLAADLACGRDNPLLPDMEGLGTPSALPPAPALGLGVRARLARERWRWRAEA